MRKTSKNLVSQESSINHQLIKVKKRLMEDIFWANKHGWDLVDSGWIYLREGKRAGPFGCLLVRLRPRDISLFNLTTEGIFKRNQLIVVELKKIDPNFNQDTLVAFLIGFGGRRLQKSSFEDSMDYYNLGLSMRVELNLNM